MKKWKRYIWLVASILLTLASITLMVSAVFDGASVWILIIGSVMAVYGADCVGYEISFLVDTQENAQNSKHGKKN